jgi:HEAT repeat protein
MTNKNFPLRVLLIGMMGIILSAGFLSGQSTPFDLEATLAHVSTYEYGQPREAVANLIEYAQSPQRTTAELKEIENKFIHFLKSKATHDGKDQICRLLSLIGSAQSVPALAEMLIVPDSSDMARYALERIPGPEAGKALLAAVGKTTGKTRIGVVNSLGMHKETGAVNILANLLKDQDVSTAVAAAQALGTIGGPSSMKVLAGARPQAQGEVKTRITESYLRVADQMRLAGNKQGALPIYLSLNTPSESLMVQVAALRGIALSKGKDALPVLMAAVEGKEQQLQGPAIRMVNEMSGADVTKALAAALPKLPPAAQIQVLTALGDRGDKTALDAIIGALFNESNPVKAAALQALSLLGDASSVKLLAESAANSTEKVQIAAREGLYRLRGPNVDSTISSQISSSSPKVKIELIRAVGERGMTSAVGQLLQTLQETDNQLRRESLRALREVGGAAEVPALLDYLTGAASGTIREETGRTLSAILRRTENANACDVLKAFQNANPPELKATLLQTMGNVGDAQYLGALERALTDGNEDVKRSAVLALSTWPDSAPMEDLLGVTRNNSTGTLPVLALRGYIRLVALPSKRSAAATVALLKDALTSASRIEEKQAVLGVLPQFSSPEALDLAKLLLVDSTVAKEAQIAVERIQKDLSQK